MYFKNILFTEFRQVKVVVEDYFKQNYALNDNKDNEYFNEYLNESYKLKYRRLEFASETSEYFVVRVFYRVVSKSRVLKSKKAPYKIFKIDRKTHDISEIKANDDMYIVYAKRNI